MHATLTLRSESLPSSGIFFGAGCDADTRTTRAEHRRMVQRDGPMVLSKQCALLGRELVGAVPTLRRARAKRTSISWVASSRHGLPVLWEPADGATSPARCDDGREAPGPPADARDGDRGDSPAPEDEHGEPRAPSVSLSATRRGGIGSESSVVWIRDSQPFLIVGATGSGKSFLTYAFGHQACRVGLSTHHYRVSRLLEHSLSHGPTAPTPAPSRVSPRLDSSSSTTGDVDHSRPTSTQSNPAPLQDPRSKPDQVKVVTITRNRW